MARTELFVRKASGGVFTVANQSLTTGNIFFVDSGSSTGSDAAGYGNNPDAPFATWDYAVGQCAANNGDRIYLMPGHAETVSAAGGIDLDVAGVTTIGIGDGSDTPTVTLDTATTADVDVDAANVTVENVVFTANFADIAVGIDVNATDFTLRRCRFQETATNMNAKIWVQDAAAAASDRITVEDCYCKVVDAANTHFINFAGTGDGHRFLRNTLIGDWGTMAVGGAGVITFAEVGDNKILNAATTDDGCLSFAATATGLMYRNLVGAPASSGQTNHILAPDFATLENYASLTAGEDLSGILEPIAT